MKKIFLLCLMATAITLSQTSCKRCKQCRVQMLGVSSPAQELCSEQLEQAEKTPGMVCE